MNNLIRIGKGLRLQYLQYKDRGFFSGEKDRTKLLYPFRLLIHPIDAFNDIKYKKKASLLIANIIMFLYFLIRIAEYSYTGYLFSRQDPDDINVISILAQSVGVIMLWTICNWASCTLFDGEGTAKEIWIMTSYSFIPYVIIQPVAIFCTYIFSKDEAIILNSLRFFSTGWTVLLIFLGMMIAQQFSVKKTILLAIVTILIILALCFLFLLFFSISQQMVAFVSNIILELTYR